jgi:hypothetical protein
MVQHTLLFIFFALSLSAFAQDERYYRQILNGELPTYELEGQEVQAHQFNVQGALYSIDLNNDGIEESIQAQKRDGVDWIEIKDFSLRKIFESKLLAMGGESSIYKIKIAQISPKAKVLVVFVDEGKIVGKRFESTARIFLLTFDNNDLSTMKMTTGPHHFHEKESHREKYWRRDYSVEIRDVNNDGTRDVVVTFNHIQRILTYKARGEWERL